jgi:hypothetical protein
MTILRFDAHTRRSSRYRPDYANMPLRVLRAHAVLRDDATQFGCLRPDPELDALIQTRSHPR